MAEQLELTEQLEHPNIENTNTPTPSTSNPSGNPSERTTCKEKSSKSAKLKTFPFSWPEIFDSKFMSLLSKQDLVLEKSLKQLRKTVNKILHNWEIIINHILIMYMSAEDVFILTTD